MKNELITVVTFFTIIILTLTFFNYVSLLSLKHNDVFRKYTPILIKIIILLPPLAIIYYFIVELIDFFNDYFNKQN